MFNDKMQTVLNFLKEKFRKCTVRLDAGYKIVFEGNNKYIDRNVINKILDEMKFSYITSTKIIDNRFILTYYVYGEKDAN